jgi:hypothetical protein
LLARRIDLLPDGVSAENWLAAIAVTYLFFG